ncbi:MAG: hypothetical protein EOO77_29415 [Oxalobacteraceae bacterium]|nr:MAG: hypothetical protein EOO77_29415 [Oxalobacteraceae bacterium]
MYDHVSDLHLDNAMQGGPIGTLGRTSLVQYKTDLGTRLIVAGDTSEYLADTVDVLNGLAPHYELVVAVLGNHEKPGPHARLAGNVVILDLLGHPLVHDRVGYVGGCLGTEPEVDRAVDQYRDIAGQVDRVILVSHFVPTPRLSMVVRRDIAGKCNDLLDRLGPVLGRTDVVFGHVHLEFETQVDGMPVHSNPRGYRGKRRDGTFWRSRFASFT